MHLKSKFTYPSSKKSIINGSRHYSINSFQLPSVTSIISFTTWMYCYGFYRVVANAKLEVYYQSGRPTPTRLLDNINTKHPNLTQLVRLTLSPGRAAVTWL